MRALSKAVFAPLSLALAGSALGQVGIGTLEPSARLHVQGVEHAQENALDLLAWQDMRVSGLNWADDAPATSIDLVVANQEGYFLKLSFDDLQGVVDDGGKAEPDEDLNTTNASLVVDGDQLVLTDSDGNSLSVSLDALSPSGVLVPALTDQGGGRYLFDDGNGGEPVVFETIEPEPWRQHTNGDPAVHGSQHIEYRGGNVVVGSPVSNGAPDPSQQSFSQSISHEEDNGSISTPWLYASAVEAPDEKGQASTLVVVGQDDYYVDQPGHIALVTNGGRHLTVDPRGQLILASYHLSGPFEGDPKTDTLLSVDPLGNVRWLDISALNGDEVVDTALGTHDQTLTEHRQIVSQGHDLTFLGDGLVGVGTDSPIFKLDVHGEMRVTENVYYGGVLVGNGAFNTSDARLKTGIVPFARGLDIARQMEAYQFQYRDDPNNLQHYGVLAQELMSIDPTLVQEFDRGAKSFLAVNLPSVVFLLADAVKQLDQLQQDQQLEFQQNLESRDALLSELITRVSDLESGACACGLRPNPSIKNKE